MAKPNQVPESSMEEILASIRKIISEDESKSPGAAPAPERPASNVSRLFGDGPVDAAAEAPRTGSEPAEAEFPAGGTSVDAAPDWPSSGAVFPGRDEPAETAAAGDLPPAPPERASVEAGVPAGGSLLSPHADAAVTSAFNRLAGTILSANSRTIEQVAEDMMRPMLKDWLDENLPPLVERLVREEIERVSRRR